MKFLIPLKPKQSTSIAKALAALICLAGLAPAVQADSVTAAAGVNIRIAEKAEGPSKAEIAQSRTDVKQLEKLAPHALEAKANKGDPLAGLALAEQLSGEVQTLSQLPALANNAAEDAARWYSLAARMGALQSQSLSGISMKPLRATRRRHR